ncbi:hypothetical protein BKA62DRAFT_699132 [Auriculariales sp. MPI-PUGE-AT-0066]|nr:hypothetical protein BKA62DRAFT_699132 [Auriculariales sp. MPI-PUGE-AT-0066]
MRLSLLCPLLLCLPLIPLRAARLLVPIVSGLHLPTMHCIADTAVYCARCVGRRRRRRFPRHLHPRRLSLLSWLIPHCALAALLLPRTRTRRFPLFAIVPDLSSSASPFFPCPCARASLLRGSHCSRARSRSSSTCALLWHSRPVPRLPPFP